MVKQVWKAAMAFVVLAAVAVAGTAQASDWDDAKDVVVKTTDAMLQLMKDPAMRQQENFETLYGEVDATVSPVVDFDSLSKGVMAHYYRQASDAQKAAFADQFKTTVIRTFTKALQVITLDKYQVVPSQGGDRDGKASVRFDFATTDGKTYRIEYSMHKKGSQWLVYNVTLDGINVGLNFRNQFAEAMNREQDMDKVINTWTVAVKE